MEIIEHGKTYKVYTKKRGGNLTNQDKKRWLARYQEINKDIDQLLLDEIIEVVKKVLE